MAKFIDESGLKHVFSKIKANFVAKEEGKGLSTNDFTTTLKNKLENLEGAPEYSAMGGATADAPGSAGLVPAPAAGDDDAFLKGDGTWGELTTITNDEIDTIYDEI